MIMLLKNSLCTTGKITFTKFNYFFMGSDILDIAFKVSLSPHKNI